MPAPEVWRDAPVDGTPPRSPTSPGGSSSRTRSCGGWCGRARGEQGPADRGDAGRPGAGPARRHAGGPVPAGRRGRQRDHQPVLGHRAARGIRAARPTSLPRPIDMTFEIDIWGRLRRASEAARAELLASEEARHAVVMTLVSDVATRLPPASPARSGARDHPAERRRRVRDRSQLVRDRFEARADDRARPPSGRGGAREHRRPDPGSRAADRADREPAQHPARPQPRRHRPRPAPHRADLAADRPGRAPVGAPRAAARHPPGRGRRWSPPTRGSAWPRRRSSRRSA